MTICPACGMSSANGVCKCNRCSLVLDNVEDEAASPMRATYYGPSALLRRLGRDAIEPGPERKHR